MKLPPFTTFKVATSADNSGFGEQKTLFIPNNNNKKNSIKGVPERKQPNLKWETDNKQIIETELKQETDLEIQTTEMKQTRQLRRNNHGETLMRWFFPVYPYGGISQKSVMETHLSRLRISGNR